MVENKYSDYLSNPYGDDNLKGLNMTADCGKFELGNPDDDLRVPIVSCEYVDPDMSRSKS